MGTRELALHDRDFLAPGVRSELHVPEVPVVVGDAHSGEAGPRGHLLVEPGRKGIGRLPRALYVGGQAAGSVLDLRRQRGQVGALLPYRLRAEGPQVLARPDEVGPGLLEQRGDRADADGQAP